MRCLLLLYLFLLLTTRVEAQTFLDESTEIESKYSSGSKEERTADGVTWGLDPGTFETTTIGGLFGSLGNLFGNDFSNPAFRKAFWKGGTPFKKVIDSLDFARSLSREICELPSDNENGNMREHQNETDAVRHFILSSYLASMIGEPRANLIMSAREKKETINKYDLMDQHNNILGFELGRTLYYYRKNNLKTDDEIKAIIKLHAEKKLKRGQFAVLSSGGKFYTRGCSSSKYPNSNHKNVKVSSFIIISGTYTPECDKKFIRNICKDRGNSRGVLFCIKRVLKSKFEKKVFKSTVPKYLDIVDRRRKEIKQCIESMKKIEDHVSQEEKRLKTRTLRPLRAKFIH